tara:strand:- start:704 stop:1129 length:426 start_codon:yes stop_codon:yes gene_type:complete
MNQEEIIKALTEIGYPLEKLRQYPWFRRGEQYPGVNIDNRNVWSQGVEYGGQEYLAPGVATQSEIQGIPLQGIEGLNYTSHSRPVSADMQEVPYDVTGQKLKEQSSMSYLGQPWGVPVEDPDEGTMLGELISRYMGSLSGF